MVDRSVNDDGDAGELRSFNIFFHRGKQVESVNIDLLHT